MRIFRCDCKSFSPPPLLNFLLCNARLLCVSERRRRGEGRIVKVRPWLPLCPRQGFRYADIEAFVSTTASSVCRKKANVCTFRGTRLKGLRQSSVNVRKWRRKRKCLLVSKSATTASDSQAVREPVQCVGARARERVRLPCRGCLLLAARVLCLLMDHAIKGS